jgi:hypothetical protein
MSVPAPSLRRMRRSGAVSTANIVHTREALDRLLKEKPACWQWAAFASVLVQRRAAVAPRLLEQKLRLVAPTGRRLHTGRDVGLHVRNRLADVTNVLKEMKAFDLTPSYMGMFGVRGEGTADADGIVHVAHGLMDYHDQLLAIAEQYRSVSVPGRYAGLLSDCLSFMEGLLEGYHTFANDYVERVTKLREFAVFARGNIEFDPVPLYLDGGSQLIAAIWDQLRAID